MPHEAAPTSAMLMATGSAESYKCDLSITTCIKILNVAEYFGDSLFCTLAVQDCEFYFIFAFCILLPK